LNKISDAVIFVFNIPGHQVSAAPKILNKYRLWVVKKGKILYSE